MRKDRHIAFKLRLKGKSYTEIYRTLGIPKSTLSGWFSDVVLSDDVRKRIERRGRKKAIEGLIRRNKKQTSLAIARALQIRRDAADVIIAISNENLLFLGASLYWAEGYKMPVVRNGRELTHHVVSLTNSDPLLIKIFLRFLREYCSVPEEKIKASIRIFQHHNERELFDFWRKVTGIQPQNFWKTYYGISKSSLHKRPFNRLPHGVIQISVGDTRLFHRIMGYIEGIKKLV